MAGLLLLITLVMELGAALVRYWLVAGLVVLATRDPERAQQVGLVVAAAPLVWAVLPLTPVPSGTRLRRTYGARHPSTREHAVVDALLQQLGQVPGVRLPRRWYVVDRPLLFATTLGTTLYLQRATLNQPYLAAMVAHELSHLSSWDSRLHEVLARLEDPPLLRWIIRVGQFFGRMARPLGIVAMVVVGPLGCLLAPISALIGGCVRLAVGGYGPLMFGRLWDHYWRQREYAADAFVQRLGYGAAWEQFLSTTPGVQHAQSRIHPATAKRVSRMRRAA